MRSAPSSPGDVFQYFLGGLFPPSLLSSAEGSRAFCGARGFFPRRASLFRGLGFGAVCSLVRFPSLSLTVGTVNEAMIDATIVIVFVISFYSYYYFVYHFIVIITRRVSSFIF